MSRRPAVLEGYQAPRALDMSQILEGIKISQDENHFQQQMAERQKEKRLANTNKRDENIANMYKPNATTSGTIYDATGLKATQDLLTKAQGLAKANPNLSATQIQTMLAPESNKIAQYYQKAKTIKENNKIANEGLNKLGGYNTSEIDLKAQQLALVDPKTGKIRDDIDNIDETQPWWKKAIETYPMETTTNEGLHKYVETAKTNTTSVGVKRIDKNRGMVSDKLEITAPPFMQIEKDAKGNPVVDANGSYSLEPKFETLPNGTKILDKATFDDIKNNQPAYYQRLMGEVAHYIKTNNDESDDNIPLNSVEAENIARALAHQEIKPIWGNRGVKRFEEQKQPPAPRITINNGSGKGSGDVKINDIYGEINNKYNSGVPDFGADYKIPLNELSATAQGVILKYANELTGASGDNKITQSDVFVTKGQDGNYNIVDKESQKVIAPLDFKDINLKTQPNSKAKVEVVKQAPEEKITTAKTYKLGGKDITEEQLQKGAAKYKMSVEAYKKSIGL